MKKSPFSTPRGYGGPRKHWHKNNSPYQNSGYIHHRNNSFDSFSPKVDPTHLENDDFIPFNTSSPSPVYNNRHSSQQFFRPRGRRNNSFGSQGSCGDNSPKFYIDSSPTINYDGTPKHRFSKSGNRSRQSPMVPIDQIPISKVFDQRDVLADPWENLMNNYNKSRSTNELDTSKTSHASDLNDESTISMDNSALEDSSKCSQEMEDDRTNAISNSNTTEILETKEIR